MKIAYSSITNTFFAQSYDSGAYGSDVYGGSTRTTDSTTTTGAPNTGFLGLTPDAAIASGSGALLVAIAIAGIVTVLTRRRSRKLKTQE